MGLSPPTENSTPGRMAGIVLVSCLAFQRLELRSEVTVPRCSTKSIPSSSAAFRHAWTKRSAISASSCGLALLNASIADISSRRPKDQCAQVAPQPPGTRFSVRHGGLHSHLVRTTSGPGRLTSILRPWSGPAQGGAPFRVPSLVERFLGGSGQPGRVSSSDEPEEIPDPGRLLLHRREANPPTSRIHDDAGRDELPVVISRLGVPQLHVFRFEAPGPHEWQGLESILRRSDRRDA